MLRRVAAAAADKPQASDLEAQIRWVVDGHRLGRFTVEQSFDQILELVG